MACLTDSCRIIETAPQVTSRKRRDNFRGSNWLTGPGLGITFFKDLEEEAKSKGYTEEELNREIDMVREKLVKEIYK